MPQLNTSTWSITILSSILTLFLMLQLKIVTHTHPSNPMPKDFKSMKHNTPWDKKWTKIYLPLS